MSDDPDPEATAAKRRWRDGMAAILGELETLYSADKDRGGVDPAQPIDPIHEVTFAIFQERQLQAIAGAFNLDRLTNTTNTIPAEWEPPPLNWHFMFKDLLVRFPS